MYRWRATIGLISPGTGPNMEMDFHRFLPEGVSCATTRIPFGGPTPESLMKLADRLEETAAMFKRRPHDLVMFGCTSGSLIGGLDFDQECIRRIERSSGTRGMTTSTALLEGFRKLGVCRPAIVTPYPDDTNEAEARFLSHHGIDCTTIRGMKFREESIADIEPGFVYQSVAELDLTGADSIFISCTGLNVLDIIPALEEDYGLPVITSNQVTLWGCLRHASVGTRIPDLGTLFTL